jgi:peptidoglycan hydrolase CwlO-like protein
MNSITREIDRLDGQITSLLQKVEDLQSENQRLLQKINALENRSPIAPSDTNIKAIHASLSHYIDRLDRCIDTIKSQ